MGALLAHRGPDGEGLVQPCPDVALAHRRLSIIDLEGGRQPMSNEDGSIWLTFNGEIFNYRALRADLIAKGHVLRTRCDAEVIVHLYEEEGTRCLRHLNGQFAFALWDGTRLFCARDPIGVKPLYYYWDGRCFAFASEPRAFFAASDLDMSIDVGALDLYFRYHYIPAPRTGYARVRKLRAGEMLVLEHGGTPKLERYWELSAAPIADLADPDTAVELLRDTLDRAVRRQMVADVPVGAFLSGGIDSSTVALLAQRASATPLRTFTVGFQGKDERGHARELAAHARTQHTDRLIDAGDAERVLFDLLEGSDEPAGDTSLLSVYAVSRLAREHTKVALSGDGGDELFAGYERYLRVIRYLHLPRVLRPIWPLLRRRLPPLHPRSWPEVDTRQVPGWPRQIVAEMADDPPGWLYGAQLRELRRDTMEDPVMDEVHRFRDFPPLSQTLAVDLHTSLPDRLLAKVDRASMATSLEVRVPLLDVELVELAFRLPPAVLLHRGQRKGILREAMRDALPAGVLARKKTGFGSPVKRWFARELKGAVSERLHDSIAVAESLLDRRGVESLLTPRRNGDARGARLWRTLALECWLRGVRTRSTAVQSAEPALKTR
jgi:asparagine synthase (glutamine-hydrolysing)